MEYNIVSFAQRLQEWFTTSSLFPKMYGDYLSNWGIVQTDQQKHPNRHPQHLSEVVSQCMQTSTIISQDMQTITFDIGNVAMESNYPYYHILENSKIIRKKDRGTKKTKGSQDQITIKGQRDYELVSFGGKIGGKLFKEYSRNVRGQRSRIGKVSHWATDYKGDKVFLNKDSNSYLNVHYRYIEKVLDQDVVYKLAQEFGMKIGRKQDSGLEEELALQWDTDIDTILDIMSSFD